jgi:hypothetical protein
MRRPLSPHPDFPCPAVTAIEVEIERAAGPALALRYILTGRVADLAVPAPASSRRTDELWRHTCFEAFVRVSGPDGYCEFNFSPSGDWAAYAFTHYREGMTPVTLVAPPGIHVQLGDSSLGLSATLDLAGLTDLTAASRLRVALTAVIEDTDGVLSYWALHHADGRPDFHHSDGFTMELSPP